MKAFLHLLACAIVAGVTLAAGMAWLFSDPALRLDLIARESERSHELEEALFRCRERACVMDRLVEELSASELSLDAALQQSREVYTPDPVAIRNVRAAFGGETDNEVLCRLLIGRVAKLLRRAPGGNDRVVPRLAAEFKQLYPLAELPVIDPDDLPTRLRRQGAEQSRYDPIDPGF